MHQTIFWQRIIFWPLILFLISEYIARGTTLYKDIIWLDIPIHFLGGAFMAVAVDELLLWARREKYIADVHPFAYVLFVTSVVTMIAVFWEFHEYLRDFFFHTRAQISQGDTMHDLLMGVLGGMLGALFLARKK